MEEQEPLPPLPPLPALAAQREAEVVWGALATSPRSLRADAQFMRIAVAIDHECLRFATGALAATTRDDDDAGGARARRREEVALRCGLVGYEIPEHLLVVPCV